jgi:hypothetical protein
MLGTNIKIKFKYLDTERAKIAFCVYIEFEDFLRSKKNEMRRVYILKTRIGIETSNS